MQKVLAYIAERLKERSTRLVLASAVTALAGGAIPIEATSQVLGLISTGLALMVAVTKDKQA